VSEAQIVKVIDRHSHLRREENSRVEWEAAVMPY
jgi:hypothetical protein